MTVTYGNGKFVAVAESGTNKVMTSVDGEVWEAHAAAEDNFWNTVTYAQDPNNPALVNGKFVAVARRFTHRVMTLDVIDTPAGLYFDDKLLYTSDNAAPILDGVNQLANLVVNNTEEIEVLAPTLIRADWTYTGSSTPAAGEYTLTPAANDFASATKLIIHVSSKGGQDYTSELAAIEDNSILTIQNLDDPYGLSARVGVGALNANGDYEFDLNDVRAVDDSGPGASRNGDAVIKFRAPTSSGAAPTLKQVTDEGAETDVNVTVGSLIKMDDGEDAYNGGPHELEARRGQATDWGAWIDNNEDLNLASGLLHIAYGNGIIVATAGQKDYIRLSTDNGTTWQAYEGPKTKVAIARCSNSTGNPYGYQYRLLHSRQLWHRSPYGLHDYRQRSKHGKPPRECCRSGRNFIVS